MATSGVAGLVYARTLVDIGTGDKVDLKDLIAGGGGLEIGTTATTAMAGNKIPTATERGGVLLQTAIVALTDSSGGTSGGNAIAAIPAVAAAATGADTITLPTKASVDATVTALKNSVATLSAKYNALLAAVKAAGITA